MVKKVHILRPPAQKFGEKREILRVHACNIEYKDKEIWDFRENKIMVNVTLCFSAAQALLAAKAGASFISPFVGRLDDIGEKGMDLIEDIVIIYENYGFDTEVLVASIRTKQHVIDAALIGANVVTLPPKIIHELYKHQLTDKGLKSFLDDWIKTGQSILKK